MTTFVPHKQTFSLHRDQVIDRPLEEVFSFFENPENLAKITPPQLGFRITTPLPIIMREGAVIDYTIRPLGFPIRWKTLITSYEPPVRFVDEQILGPYAFWRHEHTFTHINGHTLISDDVHYALPFGLIGKLVHKLLVRGQLEKIFAYRGNMIGQIFGAEEFPGDQLSGSHFFHPSRSIH